MTKNHNNAPNGPENHDNSYRPPSFTIFLSSLSLQAMIAMGKLENPLNGKKEQNLNQARFLIETLEIIKEKTKDNLSSQEKTLLDNYLNDLRTVYQKERAEHSRD